MLFLVFLLESANRASHGQSRSLLVAAAGFRVLLPGGRIIGNVHGLLKAASWRSCCFRRARWARRTGRKAPLTLIVAGLAATAASFLIQITAPGVALRSAQISPTESVSKRALPDLLRYSAEALYVIAGQETIFAGFILLFGFGLFAALLLHVAPRAAPLRRPAELLRAPLFCGFVVQLLSLPLLWMHTSDQPSVLGRFSYAYATVVALNLGLLLHLPAPATGGADGSVLLC